MDRGEILAEARRLTYGDRNADYGDPVENHNHIAAVVNAWRGLELTAADIAAVHVATKLCRQTTAPAKADSYVDACAYVGIMYECENAADD